MYVLYTYKEFNNFKEYTTLKGFNLGLALGLEFWPSTFIYTSIFELFDVSINLNLFIYYLFNYLIYY